MSRLRVGLISPYRGGGTEEELIENLQNARMWKTHQQIEGRVPVIPHLILDEILDDNEERERALGMCIGRMLYMKCDYVEVRTFGQEISEGMKADIKYCKDYYIELRGEI